MARRLAEHERKMALPPRPETKRGPGRPRKVVPPPEDARDTPLPTALSALPPPTMPPAPADPPPPALPPDLGLIEAEARAAAQLDLTKVRQQIQQRTAEMLAAPPSKIPALTQELQRLRVAMLMLREIVEDVADPNAYRELSLLTKMMDGQDPESEALQAEQEQGQREAHARLASVGLTPEGADSMVRVYQSLQTLMQHALPPEGHEPLDPDDADDGAPTAPTVS